MARCGPPIDCPGAGGPLRACTVGLNTGSAGPLDKDTDPPLRDTNGKSVTIWPEGDGVPPTLPPPVMPTKTAPEVSLTVTVRCDTCCEDCAAVTRTTGVACAYTA